MSSIASNLSASLKLRLGSLYGFIVLLHLVGVGFLAIAASQSATLVGLGVLAYTFGLRHAFDADHIAAIDNTTRKFLQEGKKQVGVGFFFSLGHSTIVFLMAALLAVATKTAQNELPFFQSVGGIIGASVSGVFLYIIGILNLIVLISIFRIFLKMRRGDYDANELEEQLLKRGFMGRFFGRLFNSIKSSWQMYPLGLLFGLGFDTASEIALLTISGSAGAQGVPVLGILALPILFASGMSLMDTTDGAFMAQAYSWAFSNPIRKVYYNLTVTTIGVAVALLIGTVELYQVLTQGLDLSGVLGAIQDVSFGLLGYIVVGLFLAAWGISYLIWRTGRFEERWSGALGEGDDREGPHE